MFRGEAAGLAGTGDLCLRLWEASDPSVALVELNYKRVFLLMPHRLCLGDGGRLGFILGSFSVTDPTLRRLWVLVMVLVCVCWFICEPKHGF